MKEIARISLDNEMDLILAHKRTIKLAELCGLIASSQTRFATAVSEIARCSITHGENSALQLGIHSLNGGKKQIMAVISDSIDLESCNPDAYAYASRLSKDIQRDHAQGKYTTTLTLKLPYSGIISESRLQSFVEHFKRESALSPYEEIRKKNIQLIELSEKLSDSESKYRQVTDTLPLIVFSVNAHGMVSLANKQLKDLLGDAFTSFTTPAMRRLFHAEDADSVLKGWEMVKKRGKVFKGQARVNIKDSYLWHLISIVPESDENGNAPGWIISMVDIHAQKLIEETLKDNRELREAQEHLKKTNDELFRKNKELEQFAYIASHDLQEPLRKIRNFTSLAERSLTKEEKEKLYFNKINASAERMSRLITDVLNYSKLTNKENEFSEVDLNVVMSEVIDDFEFQIAEKKADISLPELPVVKGIPVQLGQLFYNLIGNSLKFTEAIPVISIGYEYLENSKSNQPENKNFHKISVTDNGIGIDDKYISKIFTIFKRLHHQSEYEGTGIGLALCDKIVENHGGRIAIHSIPGSGTTIDVFLPVLH